MCAHIFLKEMAHVITEGFHQFQNFLREAEADVFYLAGFLSIATAKNEVQGKLGCDKDKKEKGLLEAHKDLLYCLATFEPCFRRGLFFACCARPVSDPQNPSIVEP